ncbi:MAG: histidinol-phosphatase HisJ family protein [Clostridia bacterium]|nr:histidinol-phosphatase HisJ family protein [Clostridia bacterium]
MFDNHTHSQYSCDIPKGEGNTIRELCISAIEKGLSGIAVTDHYDIDGMLDGHYPPLDSVGIAHDVMEAKEEFKGKLKVLHGIELAQANQYPIEATEKANSQPYDIVLGSLHTVKGMYDFGTTSIEKMSKNEYVSIWNRYLSDMIDVINWGNFDVLTHITYPKRYYLIKGIPDDFPDIKNKGREYFEPILKAVIDKGFSLECNTSGLRQTIGECLPNEDLFRFYYELGGRDVSIGSDAHFERHLGANFKEATEMLKNIGFEYLAKFESRKKDFYKI